MNHSIYVFLDEGSLNGKAAMPSASAVVTSDPERLRRSVAALARKISLEQGFRIQSKAGLLMKSFKNSLLEKASGTRATRMTLASLGNRWMMLCWKKLPIS